jgi:hypothetical protein
MAQVDVSTSSDLDPKSAWQLAADLSRFHEWLTIFAGWRGAVPATIDEGTKVSSCIKVRGFRNVIHWTVTRYEEPQTIELRGRGRGGIRIALTMNVADNHPGSTFHLEADLSGGLMSGPVGRLVVRVVKSDVHQSITNLAALR